MPLACTVRLQKPPRIYLYLQVRLQPTVGRGGLLKVFKHQGLQKKEYRYLLLYSLHFASEMIALVSPQKYRKIPPSSFFDLIQLLAVDLSKGPDVFLSIQTLIWCLGLMQPMV